LVKLSFRLQNGEASNPSTSSVVGLYHVYHHGLLIAFSCRPDVEKLQRKLVDLGATHVHTYEELRDRSIQHKIKEWTNNKVNITVLVSTILIAMQDILLGLNCVGGEENSLMARLLGTNAHLVSYGAMSKQHFSLPTSLFIFKNLTCHGFWLSHWYLENKQNEQEKMMETLVMLMQEGNVCM
jgi:NADPH:quinone reductase-like Zn-dependent oxidoreductase